MGSILQHRSNLLLARVRRQEDLIRETKAEIRALDNDMVEQLERKHELKPKLEDKLREEETALMDLNSQLDAFELDIQRQMKTAMSQSGVQIKRQ